MALGARRRDVSRQMVSQGLVMAVLGIAAGLAAALALTRWMAALLYGVEPADPLTYLATAGGLASVAAVSSWLGARRATRVDPMIALRTE